MNIFVSNLNYAITDGELSALFEQYGEVKSCVIIMDKFTQKSKGFGFVEIAAKDQAEAAINGLNGSQLGDRTINVTEARERQPKSDNYKSNRSTNRW